jgi:PTHB1 N-terminus
MRSIKFFNIELTANIYTMHIYIYVLLFHFIFAYLPRLYAKIFIFTLSYRLCALSHSLSIYIITLSFCLSFTSGQQSKLQILHQHDLNKSAFTFCKGNFGGVKGKEFMCVMFLDGSLRFFEQDGISQNCVLPGSRNIPTTFTYISRTDCFLILSPNWDLECYR